MAPPTVASYGTWTSPITVDHLAGDSIQFEGAVVNETTGQVYVLEARLSDGGRHALVDLTSGKDVLPAEHDVQGSIHEYGGGTAAMYCDGRILFSSHPNNGVFLLDPVTNKVDTIVAPDPCGPLRRLSHHTDDTRLGAGRTGNAYGTGCGQRCRRYQYCRRHKHSDWTGDHRH